jgi:predicted ATP-grasp superfamily ATP-dependent carboligase/thioesterase domain-containing protein
LSVAAFLNELLNRDIRLSADGERLRCSAPAGALTPELSAELARRKAEILEFLRTAQAFARQPEGIVPLQPRGTRIPIYAVGGHNGDVFAFRDLVRQLGEDQPFFGLQIPGLDGHSEPLSRVEDIAERLAARIRAFQPEGPRVIAGYCAGGGIAFELARQLARAGAEPAFLALFGCAHPSVYRFSLRYWAERLALHVGIAARLPSWRVRWKYLAERWRARLRQLRVDRFEQATLAAVRRYAPGAYAGRVCHFIPRKGWLPDNGGAARWRAAAPRTEEYYGPDSVDAERMLLDPDAAVFADLYRKCWATPASVAGKPLACVIGDLSMVRALGRDGIPVAVATSDPASKVKLSRYCTAEVRTPSWVDDPEAAAAALIAWGSGQREAPVVFYQGDHDMLALSRARSRLAPHLRCVLPPAELVEALADKLRFAALAERERLPVPFTRMLRRGSAAAAELARWDRFPCVLKPCMRSPRFVQLAQKQKAMRIRSRGAMDALHAVIESQEADFVLQEAIDGGEECIESYHVYVRPGGEVIGEFTGRKIRTAPRLYGFSTYVEITDNDEVRRLGRSVLERIGFSGVAKLDFKRDPRTQRLYLLEINPRFNLWHHAGAAAGVSIPALVYRDCLEPGSARPAGRARAGVRWINARDDWRAYQGSTTRWLAEVLTAQVNESFLLRDPLPALDDMLGILQRKLALLREARPYLRSAR